MSIILALETATAACSAAIWLDGNIKWRFDITPQRHSEIILTFIDELLIEADIQLQEVDVIAFGCGPGSFMGVRIATGIAQGVAYGIDRPVIPVSTLQALAQSAYEKIKRERIIAGLDAHMDSIYWGSYQADDQGIMQAVIRDQLSKPTPTAMMTFAGDDWIAAGNGWKIYTDFPKVLFKEAYFDIYPNAASVALIANQKFIRGDIFPPEKVEPMYIREVVTRKLGR
ncbi:tRNA (adenosine(37)-N6)-threonylcarbamoyltransferase complex dimerization subunit type 1 TsaB [Coxiella endosymbiont of Amblyomma nuttalli]|uniref:tRNA (adenosine(37)-N6)-threonylcarbamoyltransferase complex dimerization subunit type 1 TsaB n=1 Tax=Coxiella endosymbiont of Amblyomma nuttalli TaxID=2749996 RepID=UPI001BAA3614|nr:tRNA (adenosine(37)-N6)-threonylcarbamoyltransferase complex dimerization subunit type 1 TsaB [Coxiella endosymbiont of Amblyomma nuttalli]QTS83847.1 tRNA threonylcarbamoyladenosine biosynthesis protein TsaB [Coxiella endosymbiont of Amblyomma nuttalli]